MYLAIAHHGFMTNFQKTLKAWRATQDFARALNEAADRTPCPMSDTQLWFGDTDHSSCRGFDHNSKIYPYSIGLSVGMEDPPRNGHGCACHIKRLAQRYASLPRPRKG